MHAKFGTVVVAQLLLSQPMNFSTHTRMAALALAYGIRKGKYLRPYSYCSRGDRERSAGWPRQRKLRHRQQWPPYWRDSQLLFRGKTNKTFSLVLAQVLWRWNINITFYKFANKKRFYRKVKRLVILFQNKWRIYWSLWFLLYANYFWQQCNLRYS